MTDPQPESGARAPDEQFVVRLAAMHHSRDRALTGLRNWMPGTGTPQQLVDVARATQAPDIADFEPRASVGRCFAIFHAGRSMVAYGFDGSSIGRALRSLGSAGRGYGPGNPRADRLLNQIVQAQTLPDLVTELSRAVTELRADVAPPHWPTLLDDLREWTDPATRDTVRLRWAQTFYTSPEKKAK